MKQNARTLSLTENTQMNLFAIFDFFEVCVVLGQNGLAGPNCQLDGLTDI